MCPPHDEHVTSTRRIPMDESTVSAIAAPGGPPTLPSTGLEKLGHPQWESNLESESKSGAEQPAHRYVPGAVSPVNGCEKGRSVPLSRKMWYCVGVSFARQSAWGVGGRGGGQSPGEAPFWPPRDRSRLRRLSGGQAASRSDQPRRRSKISANAAQKARTRPPPALYTSTTHISHFCHGFRCTGRHSGRV